MRRVLFFRSELLPLSETFVASQAASLTRYRPWFAGLKRIPGGIPLDHDRLITATSGNSFADKFARRAYLRTGFAPAFLRNIETLAPELIHAHFATDACAALPIQQRLRTPLIVTLHGYDVNSGEAALAHLGVGRAYLARRNALHACAQLFICVSEFIRRRAIEQCFPEEKLWVHPIGIDVDYFRPAATRSREPLILFVGRLVEVKGCAYLLRAMKQIEAQIPDAQLVIIGDGPLHPQLQAQAAATLRRCTFTGALTSDAVRHWMRRAAVVAVPSDAREGFCLVACEAQAMEIPVVGFSGRGLSESIANGESGLLVPQGYSGALAHAILTLLRNQTLAASMGVAGRRRVEQRFNLRRQTALLEEKYDEVLGVRESAAHLAEACQ
ncbi:MAG TPA: glycosyltransferase [Acidobacteriaceae bacterium]|nr:glycosyltransferase [Acidobacteriaceae bacterium]